MCAQVDPERGGLLSLSKRLHMKPELLQELLELFYTRSSSEGGDGGSQEKYERSAMKKELMLAYVLVLAQVWGGEGEGAMSSPRGALWVGGGLWLVTASCLCWSVSAHPWCTSMRSDVNMLAYLLRRCLKEVCTVRFYMCACLAVMLRYDCTHIFSVARPCSCWRVAALRLRSLRPSRRSSR